MPQDFQQQYYMVVDEQSAGPFTLDEVFLHNKLSPETLVWKPGLDNWVAAKTLPELMPAFGHHREGFRTPPGYDHHPGPNFNDNQDFTQQGNNPNGYGQEYGHDGQYNQDPYQNRNQDPYQNRNQNPYQNPNQDPYQNRQQANGNRQYNRFADNPQYQSGHSYNPHHNPYNPHDPYGPQNRYNQAGRINWLPWAIVATVVGFFTSCIGAIFGIVGIVQANKANSFYTRGLDREGDTANSNAKVMTIIGLIFAGIGIIAAIWLGNFYSNLGNLLYL